MNKFKNKFNLNLRTLRIFDNVYYWFIAPLVVLLVALICGTIYSTNGNQYDGFANVGIDFKAGTVLTVELDAKYVDDYDNSLDIISDMLENNGISDIGSAQRSGTNAIIIRYTNSVNGADYSGSEHTEQMISVNQKICNDIIAEFQSRYPGITISADAEMTNAAASSELIRKAFLSIGIAMLLMLVYVVIRFDLYSGIAAICGQLHDIIIMLSLVIVFRIQINSSLIAGIITIVAYAINNTIVVFDRVREKVGKNRDYRKIDPRLIVNESVTESLKRTIFTSVTTLITITTLASFGVQSLTEFALPIIFGIIAGFYSSTFLSPSIWGLLMRADINNKRKKQRGGMTYATETSSGSGKVAAGRSGSGSKNTKKRKKR